MTERWPTVSLADACDVFTDGDWIETKDQSPSGIRLIQTGNIGKGEFKNRPEKTRHISSGTFDALRCTEVLEGDCLVSRLPDPVGRSCIIPQTGEKMITAVDCTIIRFRSSTVLPEFFNHYSQSKDYLDAVDRYCTGATRRRISRGNLGNVRVPSPPLPEQRRIVAVLDEAFAAIATATANVEKNLTSARKLFETYRNQAINRRDHGWPSVSLEDVCPRFEYGTSAKSQTIGRVPVLRMGNIQDGEIDWSKLVYSSNPGEIQKYLLRPNDVLFNRTNSPEHVGKTAIVRGEREAIFAGYLIRIHWDPTRLDPGYLNHFLNSQMARGYGKTVMSGSVNQANISGSKLKKYSILLPPVDTQKTVAATLDAMKAQTSEASSLYSHKLTLLTELKQSILHKAFTGELTADFKADDVVLSKGEV